MHKHPIPYVLLVLLVLSFCLVATQTIEFRALAIKHGALQSDYNVLLSDRAAALADRDNAITNGIIWKTKASEIATTNIVLQDAVTGLNLIIEMQNQAITKLLKERQQMHLDSL